MVEKDMDKKKPIRWDKVIAGITILTIALFSFIVYKDIRANRSEPVEVANAQAASSQNNVAQAADKNATTASTKTTVCIDAGHGGTDSGAEYKGKYEKDQTLEMAMLVKQCLESSGVTVVMTRITDVSLELEDRVNVCNNASAVAFVSIHRNYYEKNTTTKGVEAWIHSSKPANSETLAKDILAKLDTVAGVTDRGVKTGTIGNVNTDYYINAHSKCASCIIELGFMSNNADSEIVTTNKTKTAKALADGILKYLDGMGYKYG
jgi:N-acetylmuramoyl-L-alanine amidase